MSIQTYRVRSIRDAGHVIKAVAVSDTTPFQVILDTNDVDHFSLQLSWTGTIAAASAVFISNSYNPNSQTPQDETTALNPGIWTPTTRFSGDFTDPAGSAGNGEIHGQWVEAAFVKIVITPASGTGVVDGYASGKIAR